MVKKKACKNCKIFVKGSECPICRSTDLTTSWKGRIIIMNPEKSEIAKQNLAIAYYFNEDFDQTISLLSTSNLTQHPYASYWLGLAYLIVLLVQRFFPAYIDLTTVIIAIGVSSVIGVFFGVFPAKKASNLIPIEAIRADY